MERLGHFARVRAPWLWKRTVHRLRNVGVVAHIDAGKTTTSEQMLFISGETRSIGRVDDGDTVMDFLPQERERGITISSAAISFGWKKHVVNLIDTPGHVDFTIEVERSARVLDGAILVLDAVAGVQAQTQTVWKQIKKQNVATIAFVNKMDRDGSQYDRTLESIRNKLFANPIAIQYPLGSEQSFHGVVDLITLKKITWGEANTVSSAREHIKPTVELLSNDDYLYETVIKARGEMIEKLANSNDALMEKYLLFLEQPPESSPTFFSVEELIAAFRHSCIQNTVIPALCGASLRGKGVELLLDSIVHYLPSPADRYESTLIHLMKKTKKNISYKSDQLCCLAFKVVHDAMRGYMVYVRIYSGSLSKQVLYNSTRRKKERVNQLVKIHADDLENITTAGAGDVVCLIGLKSTFTGDTLVEDKSTLEQYVLEGLTIPEAVYSITIEPEKSSEQTELEQALHILQTEDPSLQVENNTESNQLMIAGLGELHLDIVIDKLKRQHKLNVYRGKAYVAYRESIQLDSLPMEITHTYDRTMAGKRYFAKMKFEVKPQTFDLVAGEASSSSSTTKTKIPSSQLPSTFIIDRSIIKQLGGEEYTALEDGLRTSLLRGPRGFPIAGIKLVALQLEKDHDTTAGSIRACVSSFVHSLLSNEAINEFLEPIMHTEISAPTKSIGAILTDLTTKRRADIVEVISEEQSQASRSTIIAHAPLATMLGYATTIRSITQGEGQFSMEFLNHRTIAYNDAKVDMA